jgi:dolichol-phosphate mannosyltransferase
MKIVILIPTYNEAISIVELLRKIEEFRLAKSLDFDVLVIDDNSPDGTADIVQGLHIPWVNLLRRPAKDGLGAAYRAGFAKVLATNKYSHVITMDADGSHRVKDLEKMMAAIGRDDDEELIVLGTRWIAGGSVENWPKSRQWLSKSGTAYAKFALGINLNDLTGGFRIYSASLLRALKLNEMSATGYCYQIEMALAAHLAGARSVEVPITFVERINGVSKMSRAIVVEALIQTTIWGLSRRFRPNADKLHYVK